jgi:hypothetical protein
MIEKPEPEERHLPKKKFIFVWKNTVYCKVPDCESGHLRDACETYPDPPYEFVYFNKKQWKHHILDD